MLLPLVRSLVFVAIACTAVAQSASPSLAGIWVLNLDVDRASR